MTDAYKRPPWTEAQRLKFKETIARRKAQPATAPQGAVVASPPAEPTPGPLVSALHEVFVEALILAIRDARVRAAFSTIPPDARPVAPLEPPKTVPIRKLPDTTILIAGPKGHQVQEITDRCRGLPVRLRFWRTDDSLQQLKADALAAEISIAMIDFIPHAAEQTMRAVSKNYIRQNGGITRMSDAVINIVKGRMT